MHSARRATRRALRPGLTAGALVAVVALAGCQGSDKADAGDCDPGQSNALRGLVDDQGALPAGNLVTVVKTGGGFRAKLTTLDAATRGLGSEDLAAIAGAKGKGSKAVATAVSDVTKAKSKKPRTQRYDVAVGAGALSKATGLYYEAALDRLAVKARVDLTSAADAVAAVSDGKADAAVVTLGALASAVDAELPKGGDVSAQVQAVAQAALKDKLALGATSTATATPQILVRSDLGGGDDITTVSDLVEKCGKVTIAAVDGNGDAATTLAEVYGLTVADGSAKSPVDALTDGVTAVVG